MTVKKEFSKLSSVRKCPLCRGGLDRGYVVSAQGIYWDTKKHHLMAQGDALAPLGLSVNNVPAIRCVKCRIAIFDYEQG